jgi:hypothetical protein
MNKQLSLVIRLFVPIAAFLLLTVLALGQVGGGYDLTWATIAGSGGDSSSGRFTVTDTLGQAIASTEPAVGDDYSLTDGFWQAEQSDIEVYLPVLLRAGP